MMGFAPDVQRGAPNVLAETKGREWYEGFTKGGQAAAAFDLITNFTQGTVTKQFLENYSRGSPLVGLYIANRQT